MSLRSHLQNIDTLIDLQDSRLLALENEFEKDLQTLEDEFEAERLEMIAHHAAESGQLKDIMAAVEADEKDRETDSKHEHETGSAFPWSGGLAPRSPIASTNTETKQNLGIHYGGGQT